MGGVYLALETEHRGVLTVRGPLVLLAELLAALDGMPRAAASSEPEEPGEEVPPCE